MDVTRRSQQQYMRNNTMIPIDIYYSLIDAIDPQQNESHANSYETESVHIEHVLVR